MRRDADNGPTFGRQAAADAAGPWRRWAWLGLAATLAALAGGLAVLAITFEPGAFAALDRLGAPLALSLLSLVLFAWAAAAARLVLLTRALGHGVTPPRAAVTAVAAEFGSSASPAGVGGVAVRVALLRSYGVPLAESTAVAGADLAIELTSGFLISGGILLVALLRPDSRDVLAEVLTGDAVRRASLPLLGALALLVALGLVTRWWLRRRARRHPETLDGAARTGAGGRERAGAPAGAPTASRRRAGRRRRSLRARLALLVRRSRGVVEGVRVRLRVLARHPRTLGLCLLLGGVQIVSRYSVLPVLVWAFTGESSPFLLFLVQGMVMLVSQVLVAPGGGGSVELGTGALLPVFLPAPLTGIVVLVWRLYTYHLNLLVGGAVFFAWMGGRGRKKVVETVRRRR